MPRQPRADFEAGIHHVFTRANNFESLFVDDRDRRHYLALTAQVVAEQEWRCLAYCLMRTHVHLLVETRRPDLSAGMKAIHGPYVQGFNRRHDRRGHLIENRFGSKRVEDDAYLWTAVGYIARNPVEAGYCDRPEDWPWSSHGPMAAGRPVPWLDADRLLDLLSGAGGDPRKRYAECVDPANDDESPMGLAA